MVRNDRFRYRRMLGLISNSLFSNILIVTFLSSCSSHQVRPNSAETQIMQNALQNLNTDYSNPRLVTGKLVLNITDIIPLSGDSLLSANQIKGIPDPELPSLRIWSADIVGHPTQKILSGSIIEPEPDALFKDPEFGNRILYWDLSQTLSEKSSISLSRTFKYITFDYRPQVDSELERQNWSNLPPEIIERYTRSETFLEQDQALIDTVFGLLENIADPVSQAQVLYDWVRSSMTYVYPPEERGVQNAFKTLAGDCGQYSALFITMARIAGIPARQQSGFNFYPGNTGSHVWSEIYLPVKGWVPVDATRKDGFLHLDNRRLITSIGLNIPLEYVPGWATFVNSEVQAGHTDFMQMFTLVSSGVTANFNSKRIVLRSVELK